MLRECYEIEFFGGPYDGHKETSDCRPIHLAVDVVWLVCENAIRLLNGIEQRAGGTFTSVALYALEYSKGKARYRFVGAISSKDFAGSL